MVEVGETIERLILFVSLTGSNYLFLGGGGKIN